jgi:hypothetical protein
MAEILEPMQRAPEGQFGLSATPAMTEGETRPDPLEEDPAVLRRLERERRLLQQAVAAAALIPVVAGSWGVLFGPALTGDRLGVSGESHYRFLAGLLLGIGLLFWSTIPNIEATGARFRLLTLLVVIGGLSRLLGLMLTGVPSLSMLGALALELVVTPILCLWQWRVARAYLVREKQPVLTRRAQPAPAPSGPAARAVPPEDVPEPVPGEPASPSRPATPSS